MEARNSASADAIVFRKDPSHPARGFFIATERTAGALGPDIPGGTMVVPDAPAMYSAAAARDGQDATMGDTSPGAQQWTGEGSMTNGMHHPPVPSMNPAMAPSSAVDKHDLGYGGGGGGGNASMLSNNGSSASLQEQQAAGSAGPAYAGGGFYAVPMPNYQNPYYVPDHSHYHHPPPPPPPLLSSSSSSLHLSIPPSHGRD